MIKDYESSDLVFKLDLSVNFSVLHSFDANATGYPVTGLIQASDGSFYGTTTSGGAFGGGTIFRLAEATETAAITLASSSNPSFKRQSVTFTATVSGNNPTGTVKFLDGNKSLGSVSLSSGVAKLSTSRLKLGSHSITAVYSGGDNNASSTSTPVIQVVQAVTRIGLQTRYLDILFAHQNSVMKIFSP